MSVREYIGARYVPVFADPIEWTDTLSYEPLTVVKYQGASYVSRRSVPEGIALANTDYWILWADYNAQLEAYRQEVQTFNGRIEANSDAIAAFNEELGTFEDTVTADSWVTNDRIADSAVTFNKLAQNVKTLTRQTKLLSFGDSWIAHANKTLVDGCWLYKVADYLNLEIENYARAGARMSPLGTNTLDEQITEALNTIATADRWQYEYIFIMGGINDYNDNSISYSNFQSGISYEISRLKEAFPQSKIIWCGINPFWADYGASARFRNFQISLENAGLTKGFAVIRFANFFRLFGQSVYRPNDDSSYSQGGGTYHPNNSGNDRIAQFIISTLKGTKPKIYIPLEGIHSAITISQNNSWSDGENIFWDFKVSIPANTPAQTFEPIANSLWSNYPMGLSNRFNAGPNQPLPAYNGLTGQTALANLSACIFVKSLGNTNSLCIFTNATASANHDLVVTGSTSIM